jgi:hypothetical protein
MIGGDYMTVVIAYLCFYLITLTIDKFFNKEEKLVAKKAKTFVRCAEGNHTLVGVTYDVLVPPALSSAEHVAVRGSCDRQECTVCVHTGDWGTINHVTQQFVKEVFLDPDEYEEFVTKSKTLILGEDQDIVRETT